MEIICFDFDLLIEKTQVLSSLALIYLAWFTYNSEFVFCISNYFFSGPNTKDKQPCHSYIMLNTYSDKQHSLIYIRTLSNIFLMTYKCYDWLIPTLILVTQYFLCVDVTLTTTLRHPLMSFAFTFASLHDCLD